MLKFIRGKGSQPSAERLRIQKELFQFQKTVQHGFPSKPSALAWDPELRLIAIASKTGAVKLYGAPGVEYYGQHEKDTNVRQLLFIPGQGRIISVCEDNSLSLFEINPDSHLLKCVKSESLEGKLKKISACCVERSGERLLIGTENGNIYSMGLRTFEMTESVIYVDVVLQSVADSFKVNPGAVESVTEQPGHDDCLLIGYTRGLLVLWNRKSLSAEQTFVASQQLESVSWNSEGQQFMTSHNDGSYIVWSLKQSQDTDASSKAEPAATTPYGPFPCKAINKVIWKTATGEKEDTIIFGGGMPRSSYGDRNTISVQQGEKQHVSFDVTSKIVDFCVIDEVSGHRPEALVVLAEEELIVIDLISDGWPCHSLPYLASLHCSAITAQTVVSVTNELYEKLVKSNQVNQPAKTSSRQWPIDGGAPVQSQTGTPSSKLVLLTGHEDGSVRFWDASGVSLKQIGKFSTSACFTGDDLDAPPDETNEETEENEWPPFRKVGIFDPYSDDPRLAVKKLCLCPVTGLLAVAGTAGQVVVAQIAEEEAETEIPVTAVNIVSDRDNFVWKGHDKLTVRSEARTFKPGFQPSSVMQVHPPAAITALVLNADWSVLAVGTAHGLALYDCVQRKGILAKCTLNPNDMTGAGEQPMARRKSFKKSLRESFRRLRKGRSQRPQHGAKTAAATEGGAGAPASTTGAAGTGPSTAAEARPVERQVEARATDDGMGSMVRCLLLVKTYIVNQSAVTAATLWAGTNNGSIYVFSLGVPAAEKRSSDPVTWILAKEIQLKHRAPVVSINVIDSSCAAVPDALEVSAGLVAQEAPGPHRVLISSEEQFKLFTLPNLRPYGKYKLTAYTGCQVRKVVIIPFASRSDATYKENCLVCLANTGDAHVLSLPDLRRQMNAQTIRKEDIHGISSALLTRNAEGLYLQSSSELQRFALSARDFLQVQCQLPAMKRVVKEEAKPVEAQEAEQKTAEVKADGAAGTEVAVAAAADHAAADQETLAAIPEEEKEKAEEKPADGNTTIVSVEQDITETSFGDLTLDSIKDHLAAALEESRIVELKSERKVQESVTVVKTTTVVAGETITKSAQEFVQMGSKTIMQRQMQSGSISTTHVTTSVRNESNCAPLAVAEDTENVANGEE